MRKINLNFVGSIVLFLIISIVTRGFYHFQNYKLFEEIPYNTFIKVYLYGGLLDIVFLYLISISFILTKYYFPRIKRLMNYLLILICSGFILINFADAFYYPFIYHRATYFDLTLLKDSYLQIYNEFKKHILLVVLLVILIFILFKISLFNLRYKNTKSVLTIFLPLVLFAITYNIWLPNRLSFHFSSSLYSLASNTPLNLAYTTYLQRINNSKLMENWKYIDINDNNLNLINQYKNEFQNSKPNIILFVLESFSASYLDPTNPNKPKTPFFDSLIQNSWFCEKSFANAATSAQSLSSIITTVPSFSTEPFFQSIYNQLPYYNFTKILDTLGYHNSFFFGGNYNHFGFATALQYYQVKSYFCDKDFGDFSKHDGIWGIYDGPFLNYFSQKINNFESPFFSIFFNLSSHYPYKTPSDINPNLLKNNNRSNYASIRYVDDILGKFFNENKNKPWFQNTLFIFVGDHFNKESKNETYSKFEKFRVPLIFYSPKMKWHYKDSKLVEQIDIGPSILHYVGYIDTFLSFGHSVFDKEYNKDIAIQITTDDIFQFETINCLGLFDSKRNNLVHLSSCTNENENFLNTAFNLKNDSLIKYHLSKFSYIIKNNKLIK